MRKFFLILSLFFLIVGCVATSKPLYEKHVVSLDPRVDKWLVQTVKDSVDTLAIVVVSNAPLTDYSFLKKLKRNYYTGHVTRIQLKALLKDERIVRINSGEQKLH
ncbi:MAG: hypothetical protein GXO77_01015 [Calditrichaeota bacterium]|nr:hypothetical protein [Calditrichota bacterium]